MSQTAQQRERSALDEFAQQMGQVPATVPAPPSAGQYVEVMPHGAHVLTVLRDEAKVRARVKARAAEAGERFYYRWPVKNKKKNTVDWVEGPTIKAANALVTAYGNCRVYCANVQDLGTHWRFAAVFIDFETGAEIGRSFMQRKSGGRMGDDAERNLDIAYQIGESKALRNVTVNALESLSDFAVEEAKQSLVKKVQENLDKYRQMVPARIAEWKIDIKRVEAVIGRIARDWLAPDIARVIALMNAIGDGMATVDETFPPLEEEKPTSEGLNKFAADREAGGEAGAAGSPPSPPRPPAASAPEQEAEQAFDLGVLVDDTVDTVMRIASRFDASVMERRENLALYLVPEPLMFYPDFVKALMQTAVKVAEEQLTVAAAKKYLGSLPMKRRE